MPLKDALLFGSVRAERTLVELDGDHKHVTWGTKWVVSISDRGNPPKGDRELGNSASPDPEEGHQLNHLLTARHYKFEVFGSQSARG